MLRLIVVCVLALSTFATQLFAQDIDCQRPSNECGAKPGGCNCPADSLPTIASSTGEDVNVGTTFTITGGRAPYKFTFDGGSLEPYDDSNPATNDANKVRIASVNGCGASGEVRWATVTVTDGCGEIKSKQVRLPSGNWGNRSLFREQGPPVPFDGQSDICTSIYLSCGGQFSDCDYCDKNNWNGTNVGNCYDIVGGYRYQTYMSAFRTDYTPSGGGNYPGGDCGYTDIPSCYTACGGASPDGQPGCGASYFDWVLRSNAIYREEWLCQ